MSKVTTERRTMRAHNNLVLQVIKSQAGTLSKAILEGVMNSIDQEAPNIIVTISADRVRIEDDGKGFAGQVVKDVFEEFGNPHPMDEEGFAKDTKFGKFRIGRGQMFAFGKNVWRSAEFQMTTDIDNMGLEYVYEEGHTFQPGCIVEIELYEALSLREIQNTIDQITRFCRYTESNLMVNGESIALDPAKLKWDVVTPEAYIKKKVVEHRWRGGTGLDVYQQGVFVETLPTSEFGLEGTIVIRQEVSVNFARNQVLRRCKRWKKIAALLKEEGIKDIAKKSKLTRQEARNFVEEFSGGEGGVSYNTFFSTACMPDITGKMWSAEQLLKLINSNAKVPKILRDEDGRLRLGFAAKGDREAEKVMQMRRAVVLDEVVLEQLRVDHIADLAAQGLAAVRAISGLDMTGAAPPNHYDRFRGNLVWRDYRALLEDVDDRDYHRFSADEFTPREDDFLRCAEHIMRSLDSHMHGWQDRENRSVGIGASALSDAWTDGATYITFDREYVSKLDLGMERDWFKVGLQIAKLYAYREDSTKSGDVEEGIEYLQCYADLTKVLPDACRHAYQICVTLMSRRAGKLPKSMQNNINKEAETHAAMLVAYQDPATFLAN